MYVKCLLLCAGLDVIPDLEVACPADDEAVPAQIPPAPRPPGWNGPSTTTGQYTRMSETLYPVGELPGTVTSGALHFILQNCLSRQSFVCFYAPLHH